MESSKQLKGLISKADIILKGILEIEKNIHKLGNGGGDEKLLKQKILDNYKTLTAQYTLLLRDIDKNFAKLALVPDLHGPILDTKYDDIPEILGTRLFDELTNKEKEANEELKLENIEKLKEQVSEHDKICVDLEKNIQEFRKVMKTSYRSTPFSNINLDSGIQLTKSVLTGNNLKVKPNVIQNVKPEPSVIKTPQANANAPMINRTAEPTSQPKEMSTPSLHNDLYANASMRAINPAILGSGGHPSLPKTAQPTQNAPPQNPQNPQRGYMPNMGGIPGNVAGMGSNLAGMPNAMQNPTNARVLQTQTGIRQAAGFNPMARGMAQNVQNPYMKNALGNPVVGAQPNQRLGAMQQRPPYANYHGINIGAGIPLQQTQPIQQSLHPQGRPQQQPGHQAQ